MGIYLHLAAQLWKPACSCVQLFDDVLDKSEENSGGNIRGTELELYTAARGYFSIDPQNYHTYTYSFVVTSQTTALTSPCFTATGTLRIDAGWV